MVKLLHDSLLVVLFISALTKPKKYLEKGKRWIDHDPPYTLFVSIHLNIQLYFKVLFSNYVITRLQYCDTLSEKYRLKGKKCAKMWIQIQASTLRGF